VTTSTAVLEGVLKLVMFWLKFGRVTRAQEAEKLSDVSVCKPCGLTELTGGKSPGNGPNFGKSNLVATSYVLGEIKN
jgi:hypothetical protein